MRFPLLTFLLILACLNGCSQGSPADKHRAIKSVPLSNYFGVNAFEWDFIAPPDPLNLDTTRLNGVKNFTGVRHYLDWEKLEHAEGLYTFNPAQSGSWNYDAMYQWCNLQGIEIVACIKTIPEWMQVSYPETERGDENVPTRYGRNRLDPASYIEQARMGFQFAARYGRNKNIDAKLIHVDMVMVPWPNGPRNVARTGMGVIKYIECDNERDKWWQGERAHQAAAEYAANLSAFYDGNKGSMGPGVGVKSADPAMKVVMAGLAAPDPDYLKEMIDWCAEHRGRRKDGSVDLAWDVINYHYYCNDADYIKNKRQTSGRAPELTNAAATAGKFVELAHKYAGDMPVWVTETGYDLNPESAQRAMSIKNKSVMETQAEWCLRTSLMYARTGVQKVFFYELVDDNPKSSTNYATSGLVNADRTTRPVADFIRQVDKLFGAYRFAETICNDPMVDRYTLDGRSMFVLWVPDQVGRTIAYKLGIGNADSCSIYSPQTGLGYMSTVKKKIIDGKLDLIVTERPVFVMQ